MSVPPPAPHGPPDLVRRRCALAALLLAAPAARAAPLRVVYPRPYSDTDTRGSYYVALLALALDKSGGDYDLRPHEAPMVSARVAHALAESEGIDVAWRPTSQEVERSLLPVPIALDQGLLGWRLLLVNRRDRERFAAVRSLAQLQPYCAGQVRDWPDTEILRANGLTVMGSATYGGLFQMLAAGRFQYFPRGLAEIWAEAQTHAALGLEVEPHLALHYPSATYFFVGKRNPALASRIEQGLRTALRDGSFERLFQHYHGETIKRARIGARTVFELGNPLLPPAAGGRPFARTGIDIQRHQPTGSK